ncbi:MAG: tripartite tricarboxylate transporter TctB family protein [Pseudomonadota bacterium]
MTLNRDFFVALFFLVLVTVIYAATYSLPEPMFGQLASWTWPRIILVPLGFLSLVLLVQSQTSGEEAVTIASFAGWLRDNVKPFICFLLFFGFLYLMPVLGMLLGGLLYVFLTLCVLGGWSPRQIGIHAGISAVFVIGMWAIFSLALGVVLPEGTLVRVY